MKPLIAGSLLLALTSTTALAADPHVARNLAATCANCHGTDGRAVPGSGVSALAGEDAGKMMQKLREFRSGARPATIMHQIAKGYTDAQLEQITAYFAQLRP